MRTNYHVITADNLLEGRTGVANEKQRLRSSRRLPYDHFQSNSMLPKLNPNFHQWYKHNFWATNVRWGGRTLSRVNDEYGYSRQLTLKLWLNKSVITKSGCMEEDFVMQEITYNKSILQKQPSIEVPSITPSITCFGLITYRGKVTYVERRYGYSRPGVSPLKIILIYSDKSWS